MFSLFLCSFFDGNTEKVLSYFERTAHTIKETTNCNSDVSQYLQTILEERYTLIPICKCKKMVSSSEKLSGLSGCSKHSFFVITVWLCAFQELYEKKVIVPS